MSDFAAHPDRLSETARARLRAAEAEAAGLRALPELVALLDTEGRGRWWVAGELAARLQRFEATAWPKGYAGADASPETALRPF